nr:immunoglobulin heavy chain junction region [Mus musculus]NSM03926.1 immunoglobulin heavy chain junction region [Mus musculus]NSM04325.1 immunoglobulin heavy chain junction region [Mus musculus]NSM06890.1 immunoglobulin heavy chain junction region [Mus musculus]NSM07077.1 immunoglobulin heavy chain junction region [Mus musculus]
CARADYYDYDRGAWFAYW